MATWHFSAHYRAADAHFRERNKFEILLYREQLARQDTAALGQTRRQHQKEVEEKPEVTKAQASV